MIFKDNCQLLLRQAGNPVPAGAGTRLTPVFSFKLLKKSKKIKETLSFLAE